MHIEIDNSYIYLHNFSPRARQRSKLLDRTVRSRYRLSVSVHGCRRSPDITAAQSLQESRDASTRCNERRASTAGDSLVKRHARRRQRQREAHHDTAYGREESWYPRDPRLQYRNSRPGCCVTRTLARATHAHVHACNSVCRMGGSDARWAGQFPRLRLAQARTVHRRGAREEGGKCVRTRRWRCHAVTIRTRVLSPLDVDRPRGCVIGNADALIGRDLISIRERESLSLSLSCGRRRKSWGLG